MLTLILMRHAKSGWDAPALADRDRPLNDRGTRSAHAMGQWLKARGYVPDAVLCSSARRTMETFERLGLDVPVAFTDALYLASPADMLQVLRGAEAPSILMLGHNPGIAAFAADMLTSPPDHPRFDDYPTCATLVARFDAPTWKEVGWGDGRAVEFAIPREVIAAEDRT